MAELNELLKSFDGEVYDLCYKLLLENEDEEKIFEDVCKNFEHKPKNGTIAIEKYFSSEEIDEYESIYEDMIEGFLSTTIKKCNFGTIKPEKFYSELWGTYCAFFSTIKEKAFAFYCTIESEQIPYQYLGKPLSMSNARFRELTDKNRKIIDKIRYINRSEYSQRTEEASLLLNCINEIEDYESKVVVLAHGLSIVGTHKKLSGLEEAGAIIKKIEGLRKQTGEGKEDGEIDFD